MITSSTWTKCTLVLSLICPVAQARSHTSVPSGAALLRRILLREEGVRFEALQTVAQYAHGRRGDVRVTHEIHLDACRSRLEYCSPPSVAGRVTVDDGKRHWEYDPRLNTAVSMPGSWRHTGPQDAARTVARILRSYTVEVRAGSRVAGRPTWCITMKPRERDRDQQIWCADRATALVLTRVVRDPSGRMRSYSAYSDLNFRPSAGGEVVAYKPPKGARVFNRQSRPPAATTLSEAHRLASGFGPVPSVLAHGFEFESAQIVSVRGAPSLHVEYSDGLIGVSLIRLRGAHRVRPNSPAARRVAVRRFPGTLSRGARYAVLSWSPGRDTYNLVADLSESTLLDIARNIPTN